MKHKHKDWEEFNIENAMAIAVTGSLNGRFDSTKDFSIVNMQNGIFGSMLAASIAGVSSKPSLMNPYCEIHTAESAKYSMIGEQIGFYNAFTNPYISDPFEHKEEKILDVFNSRLKLIKDNKIHILKLGERHE